MSLLMLDGEDARLVEEVRAFLDVEFPPARQRQAILEQYDNQDHMDMAWEREFWRKLAQRGWLGLGIPEEYGGSGGTALQRYLFMREISYYGAPIPRTALEIVAPALLLYGSEDLKRRYIPLIAAGEVNFSLGYSEPEAGTDLASLATKAELVGDEYVINGNKIFTTRAHRADYVYLAARTDPAAKKHAGISIFIVNLRAKGVEIHPLPTMHGRTNITFYDDVRVPTADRVGEENKGWRYLTGSLGLERIGVFPVGHIQRLFEAMVEIAKQPRFDGSVPFDSLTVRQQLAILKVDLSGLERMVEGAILAALEVQEIPGFVAAQIKTFLTEYKQRMVDVGLEMLGWSGQILRQVDDDPYDALLEGMWRDAIVHTFGAGTNEVQRDIIAVAELGLPRNR